MRKKRDIIKIKLSCVITLAQYNKQIFTISPRLISDTVFKFNVKCHSSKGPDNVENPYRCTGSVLRPPHAQ